MTYNMFEIQGKEYELKLNLASVKFLNSAFQGGAYELIGKCMLGDLETFELVVRASLFHTNKGFTPDDIDEAINELFESEKLDMDKIILILNKVVMNSFFYVKTTNKILKQDKQAKATMDLLMQDEEAEKVDELTLNNVSETDGDTSN